MKLLQLYKYVMNCVRYISVFHYMFYIFVRFTLYCTLSSDTYNNSRQRISLIYIFKSYIILIHYTTPVYVLHYSYLLYTDKNYVY